MDDAPIPSIWAAVALAIVGAALAIGYRLIFVTACALAIRSLPDGPPSR